MAVSRVSLSSVAQGFPKSRSFLDGNTAYDPAATWFITSVTGNGTVGTYTFSSIPSTYKHLQIRASLLCSSTTANFRIRINGDTAGNYSTHQLTGDGSTVTASGSASVGYIGLGSNNTSGNTYLSTGIIDILDYTNTSKNKTIRNFLGRDVNGTGGNIYLTSGAWLSTSAVTSIEVYATAGTFSAGTKISLYGFTG